VKNAAGNRSVQRLEDSMEILKYKTRNKGAATSNMCFLRAAVYSGNLDNYSRRLKSHKCISNAMMLQMAPKHALP